MSAWFASERIVFNRHGGGKWLAEILDEISEKIEKATGYRWVKKTAPEKSKTVLTWSARIVRRATVPLRRMSIMFGRSSDSVESLPPPYASPIILPSTAIMAPRTSPTSPTQPVVQFQLGRKDERNSDEAGRPSDPSPVVSPITPPSFPESRTEMSATRARFMNLVRSAVMVNRLIGIGDETVARVRIPLTDGKATDRKPVAVTMPRSSRVISKLRHLTPTQDIPAHAALVRHMQVNLN